MGLIKKADINAELTSIAKTQGLTDVEIYVGGKASGYDIYEVTVRCSNFHELSYSKMYSVDKAMNAGYGYIIDEYVSGGDTYRVYLDTYYSKIYKNGKTIHLEEKPSTSNTSNTGTSKCSLCNGTGSVKYYSAGSDLESILAGLDPYTFGPCSRCNGTGRE